MGRFQYLLHLRDLPKQRNLEFGGHRVLLCHGSPRRVNEFLWESTTSDHYLDFLLDGLKVDCVCATHTGIKWKRDLSANKQFVNVGVLGRPENDGQACVWYTLFADHGNGPMDIEFVPIHYDHHRKITITNLLATADVCRKYFNIISITLLPHCTFNDMVQNVQQQIFDGNAVIA